MFAGLLAFIIHYCCSARTFRRNLSPRNTEGLWQALSSICRSSATPSARIGPVGKPGRCAPSVSADDDSGGCRSTGRMDGSGWGGVRLELRLLMDVCREIQWAERAQANTNSRRRLGSDDEGGEGENEGGKLTDVQTNKVEVARRRLRRAAIKRTQSSIVVILLPALWVPWTNFGAFSADGPIRRRLAKPWPRRLGESHGCCGISLLRLSQHERGCCWLRLANDFGLVAIKSALLEYHKKQQANGY